MLQVNFLSCLLEPCCGCETCGQKWGGNITGAAVSALSHREHWGNSIGLWRHVEVRILAKSESTEAFSVIGESLLLKTKILYVTN